MYSSVEMVQLFFVFLVVLSSVCAQGPCHVDIGSLRTPEPVFLHQANGLWAPEKQYLSWRNGQKTVISCPGSTIAGTNYESLHITCQNGVLFNVQETNTRNIDIRSIYCTQKPRASALNSGQTCGLGANIVHVGFYVYGTMIPYFTVCYSFIKSSPIYSVHWIPGRSIAYKLTKNYDRISFKPDLVPGRVAPGTSYTQASQLQRFTYLLGSLAQANKFLQPRIDRYLAKGHLVPDADGVFRSWRWATYFYINAAPQWQIINARNWILVENKAREMAIRLQEDVLVHTGVYDNLSLPTKVRGRSAAISLEANGLPAPKWYWKIIKSPSRNAAIAFVTSNDPYSPAKLLCPNICAAYGFNHVDFANVSRGFTYCCKVSDLMAGMPNVVPAAANAANVMRY